MLLIFDNFLFESKRGQFKASSSQKNDFNKKMSINSMLAFQNSSQLKKRLTIQKEVNI